VSAAVRLGPDGAVGERLLTFDDARGSVRNYHPWFVDTYEGRALFYAEEERRHRLIELGCDGRVVRELALDSLGRGQVFQRTERGFRLTSPGYPFPAGLARVENRVLWATRVLEPAAGGALDSLTVITAWGSDGGPRRVTIRGWYQLFDGASDGSLLFGNSWTLGQNWAYAGTWGLIPAVFLVDGNALLRILDEAPPPVTPPAR
jgi:hypothetical protein